MNEEVPCCCWTRMDEKGIAKRHNDEIHKNNNNNNNWSYSMDNCRRIKSTRYENERRDFFTQKKKKMQHIDYIWLEKMVLEED